MPMNFGQPYQNNGASYGPPMQNTQMSAYGPAQNQFQSAPSQQFNPQPAASGFVGRYISDLSEVTPNEVPMDGRVSLFPNKDLSEVFLKSWGSDGRILTFRYVLDTTLDLNAPPAASQDYQQLADRLNQLETMVKKSAPKGRNKPNNEEEAKT